MAPQDNNGRRQHILRAAERLFLHYGTAKTTVADIAREAAVAVGSVYLEFASKDALVAEFSACRYRSVLASLQQVVERDASAQARLQAFFGLRLHAFADLARQGEHACELVMCKSSVVGAAYAAYAAEELRLLTTLLQSGTDRGELAVFADLNHVARAVVRAYATYAPPWGGDKIPKDVEALLATHHDLLWRGLAARRD